MELTNISTIKKILKENNLWAKKRFGQNFLVAKDPLDQLIKSANIRDDEVVVEVGPGLGVLTQELAKKAKLVLAIEKDYKFIEWLRKYFKNCKNVKIIHADILPYNLTTLQPYNHYKVISNLPYNITSPVIRKFLEIGHYRSEVPFTLGSRSHPIPPLPLTRKSESTATRSGDIPRSNNFAESKFFSSSLSSYPPISLSPSLMVLMVQKEVAERICAQPGSSERGILTVMVEFYAQAEIVDIISRNNFWPVPAVDSAIIKITSKHLNIKTLNPKSFFRIVKIGFSQKRRQIHNPLTSGLKLPKPEILAILKEAKINPQLRAEDLRLEDWLELYKKIQPRKTANTQTT